MKVLKNSFPSVFGRWLLPFCWLAVASTSTALQSGDFTYEINTNDTDTVTITGYTGIGGAIEIPSTISNKAVTAIGYGAFIDNTALTDVTIPDGIVNIGDSAFEGLGPAFGQGPGFFTIPASVTNIGERAFYDCLGADEYYFKGNPPSVGFLAFHHTIVLFEQRECYMYYLPNATGWGATFGDPWDPYPTRLWNPSIQTTDGHFGVQTNGFGFNIDGPTNSLVKIEASSNLTNDIWDTLITYKLIEGSAVFSDPNWTNYSYRFYRLSMP